MSQIRTIRLTHQRLEQLQSVLTKSLRAPEMTESEQAFINALLYELECLPDEPDEPEPAQTTKVSTASTPTLTGWVPIATSNTLTLRLNSETGGYEVVEDRG